MGLAILANQVSSFSIGQVLDVLLRLEGEFNPVALVIGVDETEGRLPQPCIW